MMDAGSVAFEQSLEYAMMDAGSVASEQSLESALAPTSVAAAATTAAAPTSFSLYSLPDAAIVYVSSFLQFKVVARLLKVSKSIQEAVYSANRSASFKLVYYLLPSSLLPGCVGQ